MLTPVGPVETLYRRHVRQSGRRRAMARAHLERAARFLDSARTWRAVKATGRYPLAAEHVAYCVRRAREEARAARRLAAGA